MPSPSSPTSDFSFGSGRSSARAYCLSAPTSPNHALQFYEEFDHFTKVDQTHEFAFHVPKQDATNPTPSAAELFHDGKIRPHANSITITAPLLLPSSKSPTSSAFTEDPEGSNVRKTFWSAFTPKKNKPTNNAHATRSPFQLNGDNDDEINDRGRGRLPCLSSSDSRRRGTRSLSPIRLTNYPVWEVNEHEGGQTKKNNTDLTASKSSRMRKLKDFLLFRSASEGRAPRKSEPLKNEVWWKRHYAMKKAESEDLKKKTFLPYKKAILGR